MRAICSAGTRHFTRRWYRVLGLISIFLLYYFYTTKSRFYDHSIYIKIFPRTSKKHTVPLASQNVESTPRVPMHNDETTRVPTNQKKASSSKTDMPIIVLLQFVNAGESERMKYNLNSLVKSIFHHTNLQLSFIMIVDEESKTIAKHIFQELVQAYTSHKNTSLVYYDVNNIYQAVKAKTAPLLKHFSSGNPSDHYNHILFVLPAALHLALPKSITKLIMLDIDMQVRADIKNLHDLFKHMKAEQILGLASEQQPTYRHTVYNYRRTHPNTKIGGPPPDGLPGFNSGVKLMNLSAMRKSIMYDNLMKEKTVEDLVKKFDFKGHLGDQDFFTLIGFEHPELFYNLPCQWNRQLCTWWKDNGYKDIFSHYFDCEAPIFVYHGNCNSPFPS